ncbi:Uncharacterised protein [Mycobacteroides abscessus subsp. massiliense]|nr:Uncharacterised protein [Mycobacteroides abscessus subsp. massiliense]
MIPEAPACLASGTENCAFCTVLLARGSTMMRSDGYPRPTSILRICSASDTPFCGLPPVTMMNEFGNILAIALPVTTR